MREFLPTLRKEKHLYRYNINNGEYGGCVLAADESEGESKVRKAYDQAYPERFKEIVSWEIAVWRGTGNGWHENRLVDDIDPDVVEVYP